MADQHHDTVTQEAQPETGAPEVPTPPRPPKPSDIADLLERVFLMGIGAASITKDRFDELTSEMVERGRVSQSEARKVADWMSETAHRQAAAVERNVGMESRDAVREAGVATKKDIEALQEQILEIKSMIASSRGGASSGSSD